MSIFRRLRKNKRHVAIMRHSQVMRWEKKQRILVNPPENRSNHAVVYVSIQYYIIYIYILSRAHPNTSNRNITYHPRHNYKERLETDTNAFLDVSVRFLRGEGGWAGGRAGGRADITGDRVRHRAAHHRARFCLQRKGSPANHLAHGGQKDRQNAV